MNFRRLCVIIPLLLTGYLSFSQCNLSVNLALGKPAYASSVENGAYPASNVVDGDNTNTRWSSAFSDPQDIYIDLGSVQPLCQVSLYWENAYATAFTIDISNDAAAWTTVASISGNSSQNNNISISGSGRYVRMSGISRATGYGYSLFEFQVFGPGSTSCNSTNLALNQPVTASSLEGGGFPASNAVDGNMATRWSSAFSDPQSIYVDLGSVHNICQVSIHWEAAYATAYNVDLSNDAASWTTVASVTGNGATNNILNVSGSGRYLRIMGLSRATGYGYSIFELQVTDMLLLPVRLAWFRAVNDNNQQALLQWATYTESNSDYFEVQRSADGIQYHSIGRVKAAGNSSVEKDYAFTDNAPFSGMNYYRLKQTDLDGKSDFSPIATINKTSASSSHISFYPNPIAGRLTLQSTDGRLLREAHLYNTAGIPLLTWRNAAGSNTLELATGTLPGGLYLVRVVTDKGVELLKLVK